MNAAMPQCDGGRVVGGGPVRENDCVYKRSREARLPLGNRKTMTIKERAVPLAAR